jgi:hypothetical protein
MKAKKCPMCGETTLLEHHGDFRMELPPNVPGGAILVSDANWMHCDSCGEDILSPELEMQINRQCRHKPAPVR